MDLRVLGCHGGETAKHRTSSFLVDGRVGIDAGAITSTLTLDEQRCIEAVLVSHAHMDHVRDLATLADNRCQQGGPPLRVFGTSATVEALREHFFNDHLWPDFSKIAAGDGVTLEYVRVEPEQTVNIVPGLRVTPVLVHHTIETAGFVLQEEGGGTVAYSGDTGPTRRLWEILSACADLRALLMEVSFPDEHAELARLSGHHTPATLREELHKLSGHPDLPILLYHIKPVFQAAVEKQLARIHGRNLNVLQLGDQFLL